MSQNRIGCPCCTESVLPCQDADGADTGCPDELNFSLSVPAVDVYNDIVGDGFPCCTITVGSFHGSHTVVRGWCQGSGYPQNRFGCSCEWGTTSIPPNDSTGYNHQNYYYEFVADHEPTGNLSDSGGLIAPDWFPSKYASDNFSCVDPAVCTSASTACCQGSPISIWRWTDCCEPLGEASRWYRAAMGLAWNVSIKLVGIYTPDVIPFWRMYLNIYSVVGSLQASRNCNLNGYPDWGATNRTPNGFGTIPSTQPSGGWRQLNWTYEWDATFNPCNLNVSNTDVTLVDEPSIHTISNGGACEGLSTNGNFYANTMFGYFGTNEPFTPTWSMG
jgi:hypothetical protein